MVVPSCAMSSASCVEERVAVPSSIMSAVKLARPGLESGLASVPLFSTRFAATTGSPRLSWWMTVRPLASLKAWGTGSVSLPSLPLRGCFLRQFSSAFTASVSPAAWACAAGGVGTSGPRSCLPATA